MARPTNTFSNNCLTFQRVVHEHTFLTFNIMSQQTGYGDSAEGGLPNIKSRHQPCQMATTFYELCNRAHESNIRRGIHTTSASSDYEDSNSVSSSDTKPSPCRTEMCPTVQSKRSLETTPKSLDKSIQFNSKFNDQDGEDEDVYEGDVIQANMSRKRKNPESYVHYQDYSSGNHFGNLGAELQTLKRQLSLSHASSGRATK